jgi:hypothetical protein
MDRINYTNCTNGDNCPGWQRLDNNANTPRASGYYSVNA